MIPEDNVKDLAEIPDNVKSGMEIIPVARMDDVLKHALARMPEPIKWDEEAEEAAAAARAQAEKASEGARAH
jgi:ATP-dependent Lon protease